MPSSRISPPLETSLTSRGEMQQTLTSGCGSSVVDRSHNPFTSRFKIKHNTGTLHRSLGEGGGEVEFNFSQIYHIKYHPITDLNFRIAQVTNLGKKYF